MAREEMILQFSANDEERSICLLDPSPSDNRRYERFVRDADRMKWFSKRYGFEQNPEHWKAVFDQEEYVSVIRYLEKFEWKRI